MVSLKNLENEIRNKKDALGRDLRNNPAIQNIARQVAVEAPKRIKDPKIYAQAAENYSRGMGERAIDFSQSSLNALSRAGNIGRKAPAPQLNFAPKLKDTIFNKRYDVTPRESFTAEAGGVAFDQALLQGGAGVIRQSKVLKPIQQALGKKAGQLYGQNRDIAGIQGLLNRAKGKAVAEVSQSLPYTGMSAVQNFLDNRGVGSGALLDVALDSVIGQIFGKGFVRPVNASQRQLRNQIQGALEQRDSALLDQAIKLAKEQGIEINESVIPELKKIIDQTGSIGGLSAKSFQGLQGDDLAQEFLKKGAFSDVKDRGLRFFIPDNYAKLNRRVFDKLTKSIDETGQIAETTLGTFLKHDELYKEYPQAKNLRLVFNPAIDARGQFDPSSGSIILNPKSGNWMEKLGILLHENQHYLQGLENFSRGGSPEDFFKPQKAKLDEVLRQRDRLDRDLQDNLFPRFEQATGELKRQLKQQLKLRIREVNKLSIEASELSRVSVPATEPMRHYKRLQGEIEARAVQNPNNIRLPAKDLRGKDILAEQMKLEGIKPDEVIVRSGNGVMADVGGKERGFITTLKDSPKTDPRVAGELEGAYIPQTNKTTLKTAKDNLTKDFTGAIRRAVDLKESLTPESVAEGHLLIDMLSKKGDIEGAVSVAEALAEKGTKQGQIVQAFSMWDRLTPEGMLTYAQRSVNKANEGRGAIDNILGRDNIKLSPEDAQEILKTMQDAQKVPVNERGAYTKKALEVINKAIPPSTSELFDAYRYEGMLSNPRTQLRNIHGNLLQTFVTRPMTMAFETPFDWMQSTMFGADRKRYLSDVPEYYRDVVNSIPLGAEAFMKSMKGSLPVDKPDLESVRKISGPVSRFMEGMDKFNQTIIGGAIKNDLMSKGMSEGEALEQAQKQAEYWLFRQKADPKNLTGQGYLLSAVDKLSSSISGLPGRKWFIPFIQTPTNVAKQFLELSPAGLATIPGNKNPVEQLAKTSAGTVAMLIGAKLAAEGRLSWAAPTSPEDKAIFYETRKPFSVKVGDTWVPMQYFGPFALALALPAAYEYYDKVEKKSLTSTQAQKAYNTVLNSFQFMTNQTFLTGLNNYVQVLSGDPDYSFPSSAGFTATQAVPYSGLLRYISTIVDPTMRKSKKFMDSFYTTIPGMSDKAFPYLDPTGQPVQRDPINYITPYDIKESDPFYERIYQGNVKTSQSDDIRNFSSRIRAIGRDPTLSIEEKRSKILAEERKMKTARENINKLEGSR